MKHGMRRAQLRTTGFHAGLLALTGATLWGLARLVALSGPNPPLAVVLPAIFAGGAVALAAAMIVLPGVSADELRSRLLNLVRGRRFHGGEPIPDMKPGLLERVVTRLLGERP